MGSIINLNFPIACNVIQINFIWFPTAVCLKPFQRLCTLYLANCTKKIMYYFITKSLTTGGSMRPWCYCILRNAIICHMFVCLSVCLYERHRMLHLMCPHHASKRKLAWQFFIYIRIFDTILFIFYVMNKISSRWICRCTHVYVCGRTNVCCVCIH